MKNIFAKVYTSNWTTELSENFPPSHISVGGSGGEVNQWSSLQSTTKNCKKFSQYPAVMGEVCESESSGYASYDSELEKTWLRYEEAIKSERFYILNTVYELNSDVSLHCGLSPARSFEPAVEKISNFLQCFRVDCFHQLDGWNTGISFHSRRGGEPDDHGLW
ncbi:hypothetical protein JTB14_018022 [Gonioctena quinquepunctata]|nr:hypothetical protein JTB14_018022 [Gonioctena quinquepunctata]